MMHKIKSDNNDLQHAGFTLIELMIVVVIIAVLAAVAVVAYTKHLKSTRIVGARTFIATIQARQEAYFQRFGRYCDTSNDGSGGDVVFPALGNNHCVGGDSAEPCPKEWATNSSASYRVPQGWLDLGARPESGYSYFEYIVRASTPDAHALNATATNLGIPAQPTDGTTAHPWYYIIARADLDGSSPTCDTANCTTLTATSFQAQVIISNEGQ